MSFWVYILTSRPRGTLYIGMTNDLRRRVWEHREGLVDGFTKDYKVTMLVYFEPHDTLASAVERERRIKRWARSWKIELIRSRNPDWLDLFDDLKG